MIQVNLIIQNKLGLHARASAKLSDLANRYQSEILLIYKQRKTDAKSILGVMTMGATLGQEITLEASGSDENEAAESIQALFNNRFGESE